MEKYSNNKKLLKLRFKLEAILYLWFRTRDCETETLIGSVCILHELLVANCVVCNAQ